MSMQTTTSTISASAINVSAINVSSINVSTRRIDLQRASDPGDTWNIRPPHLLIGIICSLIMLGILGAIASSALKNFNPSAQAYLATLHVETGIVTVQKAATGEKFQLEANQSFLIDADDKVFAQEGEATITFFDGSMQDVSGSIYQFETPEPQNSPNLALPAQLRLDWLRQLWHPADGTIAPVHSAASVLG